MTLLLVSVLFLCLSFSHTCISATAQ